MALYDIISSRCSTMHSRRAVLHQVFVSMNRVLDSFGHANTHRCIGHVRGSGRQQLAEESDALFSADDIDGERVVIEMIILTSLRLMQNMNALIVDSGELETFDREAHMFDDVECGNVEHFRCLCHVA